MIDGQLCGLHECEVWLIAYKLTFLAQAQAMVVLLETVPPTPQKDGMQSSLKSCYR